MSSKLPTIKYDRGTLLLTNFDDDFANTLHGVQFDDRINAYRAQARHYRDIVMALHQSARKYTDKAKAFSPVRLSLKKKISPFPHQKEALSKWEESGKRGIIELPTGAGKTVLSVLAIASVQRPTLVVVPTIDLLLQWERVLSEHFNIDIGVYGGGRHEKATITVTTYDSAAHNAEFWGQNYGFLICDECHHLPATAYQFIAEALVAPFRLGVTATLERNDGGEFVCEELLGSLNFSLPIDALEGKYLAPYEVRRVPVNLTDKEREEYESSRKTYLRFLRSTGISFNRPDAWANFIMICQRSAEGKRALEAYRNQRKIAFSSKSKTDALWNILKSHRNDRVIVFTEDNETVYRLSHQLFFPVITHHTKVKERKHLLSLFAEGALPVLLTSKVLNEGVDVPDANVGVVLSGSGSVREHVQRLGRILRKRPGKEAILYEVYAAESSEMNTSERRRQHRAYYGKE